MTSYKTIFMVALLGALLTGAYTLKDTFSNTVASNTTYSSSDIGGAAKYQGKIDIKDSPYFVHPDFYNMQPNEHLLLLTKFATTQQITEYSCGPAAANMVVTHFKGQTLHDELEVASIMKTSTTKGTTTEGMCRYFKEIGWKVASSEDSTTPKNYESFLNFIKSNLTANTPIIVENVDWGGHWRVIIGYDTMNTEFTGDDVLIMADPYDTADHLQDGYVIVPAEKFFYMWFDHQLFESDKQRRQWLTAVPK